VKQVAAEADLVLVVGSDNSSNSNRLVEVSRNWGTASHLIDSYKDIKPVWLEGVKRIALTAGGFGAGVLGGGSCEVSGGKKDLGTWKSWK